MSDMLVEDPLKGQKSQIPYSKEKFAKAMNCSVELLNRLDKLTKDIKQKVFSDESDDLLVGNIGCRYCGRWYLENNKVWVGLTFDRPTGHQVEIGFCVSDSGKTNGYIEVNKLLKAHYNYYAEYTEINEGYWFYTFFDNSLENYCSVCSAYEEVKKIIKEVLGI
ncbi:MAG: hypothetical protein J5747_08285 [Spirochaetaceae bacterium]|nr:hypothetical protein [Spirochaetaceae bacterium]